jgi:hypothetical protein
VIAVSIPKQSTFFVIYFSYFLILYFSYFEKVNYVMLLAIAGNAFYLAKPVVVMWRHLVLTCCEKFDCCFVYCLTF